MPRGISRLDEALLQRRLWTPVLLRPALWLDADDSSTISVATGVSQWRDKGPNARHFTQSTGVNQPARSRPGDSNGRAVLSFNGSQYLTSPAATSVWNFLHNTNGSSVFAVWRAGNISNPNAFYSLIGNNAGVSGNTGYYILYDDRAASSRNDRILAQISRGVTGVVTSANITADGAHPANVPAIISHIADPGNAIAANRSFIRINRGAVIQNNVDTAAASASNASFALQIGACGNNVGPLTGYVAEIVMLASIAIAVVRQKIEGYLAWKWGLTGSLAAEHPFANRPPLIGD